MWSSLIPKVKTYLFFLCSYKPIWNIIDDRWDKMLHRPLHVAAYYLNPQLHYAPGFKDDIEVKNGLMVCITKMVEDLDEQAKD